jgi:hypothetical protein
MAGSDIIVSTSETTIDEYKIIDSHYKFSKGKKLVTIEIICECGKRTRSTFEDRGLNTWYITCHDEVCRRICLIERTNDEASMWAIKRNGKDSVHELNDQYILKSRTLDEALNGEIYN